MKKLLTLILAPVVALGLGSAAFAASKKLPVATPDPTSSATPAPKEARPFPYHGDVAVVDASAKTFTFKNKDGSERLFHVGDTAKLGKEIGLSKDATPVEFSAITVGLYVAGTCTKTGERKFEVVTLKIKPKPTPKKDKPVATPKSTATPAPKPSVTPKPAS